MIHVDARTPNQFYDGGYDSYICFLTQGGRRSKTTQAAAFQARFGGEGAGIGEEGARSLQNHHGDESAPLWKSRLCKIILSSYKEWCFFFCFFF